MGGGWASRAIQYAEPGNIARHEHGIRDTVMYTIPTKPHHVPKFETATNLKYKHNDEQIGNF